jgi:hypothetical protein
MIQMTPDVFAIDGLEIFETRWRKSRRLTAGLLPTAIAG